MTRAPAGFAACLADLSGGASAQTEAGHRRLLDQIQRGRIIVQGVVQDTIHSRIHAEINHIQARQQPTAVYADYLNRGQKIEQQALLWDDCYLPGLGLAAPELTCRARLTASQGNPQPVRDGIHRPVNGDFHSWKARIGDYISYEFSEPAEVREIELILDSALDKNIIMTHYTPPGNHLRSVPPPLPKELRIEGLSNGRWQILQRVAGNYQRLVRIPIGQRLNGLRVTWNPPGAQRKAISTVSMSAERKYYVTAHLLGGCGATEFGGGMSRPLGESG